MLTVATIPNEANVTAWMQLLPPLTTYASYLFDAASVKQLPFLLYFRSFYALFLLCPLSYVKLTTFAVIATVIIAIQPLQINPCDFLCLLTLTFQS